jgi:hypothetical protein
MNQGPAAVRTRTLYLRLHHLCRTERFSVLHYHRVTLQRRSITPLVAQELPVSAHQRHLHAFELPQNLVVPVLHHEKIVSITSYLVDSLATSALHDP